MVSDTVKINIIKYFLYAPVFVIVSGLLLGLTQGTVGIMQIIQLQGRTSLINNFLVDQTMANVFFGGYRITPRTLELFKSSPSWKFKFHQDWIIDYSREYIRNPAVRLQAKNTNEQQKLESAIREILFYIFAWGGDRTASAFFLTSQISYALAYLSVKNRMPSIETLDNNT